MTDLSYVLHDLVLRLDRAAESRLAPWGLTLRRFVALTVIANNPAITSRRLGAILSISEPATSQLVAALLARQMIRDGSPPGSGRAKAWELTPAGEQVAEGSGGQLAGEFDAAVVRAGQDPDDLATRLGAVIAELDAPSADR